MKIGLQIPAFKYPGGSPAIAPRLKEIAQTAEHAGFHSIWVMDHFFQLEGYLGPADDPMLEGYSALSYIAGLTQRVKLGTLVTGVIYRYPGLLIKTATTLDVLSGGRAYLGIGAAWYDREARGLGVPYPSTADRFVLLEETLQLAHHMWTGDRAAFRGTMVSADEPLSSPQPLSQPHPPILIGGGGEKKTLRLVARFADACNLFARMGEDSLRGKLEILRQHCDDVGRDYDEIEKTSLDTIHIADGQMSPSDVIAQCEMLARLGISHAIFNMPNVYEIAPLETMGRQVIPAVAGL